MRIHFSAEKPCVLRLGGALAGSIGEAEKFADCNDETIFAEFLPDDGDLMPLAFRIGEPFFAAPPACADVYRYDCGADIFVRFSPRNAAMRVLAQARFSDTLATVFSEGTTQLSLDRGGKFALFSLPAADRYELKEEHVGKERFFFAECVRKKQTRLCIYSDDLREVFRGLAGDYTWGETLTVRFAADDIAGHTVVRTLRAEAGSLHETGRTVRPREGFAFESLHEKLIPFAFFQELLAGGDPAPLLTPALAERADLLRDYLGDFCGVYLPKEIFYLVHGPVNAVGLIYRRAENAFDVKFYRTELKDRMIANISPVE